MIGTYCHKLLLTLAFSGVLFSSVITQAAIQTFALNDPNAPRDTGWSIVYDDSQVTVLSYNGNATGNLQGSLSISKVFSDMNPISIQFVESAAQIADGSSFGLRINLDEEITNLTGANWTSYTMELVDPSVVSESQNVQHPGFAHIHPAPLIAGPPFTLTTPNNGNKAALLTFENGAFLDGSTNLWGTFGLHQYEDDGVNRSFTLIQTPLPEPSTFVIALTGLIGLVGYRRRSNRRRLGTS